MHNRNKRLTFGKHKGTPIELIPDSYLEWMRDNLDDTFTVWIDVADEELEYRHERGIYVEDEDNGEYIDWPDYQ